ncbi:hypothetical protein CTEN210_09807 [Chaetoceros tenuissimus]|uniref:RING-type E3 ubiquitin transferase n=1 Tax=Chaetoceros tenuissimus TaxID=426638 RepID=A0AAD3CY74_9STRA|nr:hypothetical protein CTEN210_09807 [Chaetoceros tenuissimus]
MSPSEIIAIDISSDDESIIVLDDKDKKGKSNQQAINKTLESRKRNSSKDVDGQPQNRKRQLMERELTPSPQLKMKKRSWPTSQETSDTTERGRSMIRKKVTLDVDDSDNDSADSYNSEIARYTLGYCNNLKRSSSNEKPFVTSSRQDEREKRKLTLCVDDSSDDDSLVDDSSDVDFYSAKADSLKRSNSSIHNVHGRSDKENDSWNCTRCTFSNSMTDISCQICNGDPPFNSSRKNQAKKSRSVSKRSREDANFKHSQSYLDSKPTAEEARDIAFAMKLQQEQEEERKQAKLDRKQQADTLLAMKRQQEEDKKIKHQQSLRNQKEESDQALAHLLQQEEDKSFTKADAEKEHEEMTKNITGKAYLLVQRIVALVENLKSHREYSHLVTLSSIETVAVDDLVFLSERLLEQQQEFGTNKNYVLGGNGVATSARNSIPTYIDIGYHYTDSNNMHHIRTNGLMSRQERTNSNISATSKGAVFGDGIYTANNPSNFSSYGNIGLVVARLQGNTVRVPMDMGLARLVNGESPETDSANTIIGDKTAHGNNWPSSDARHEFVLRKASQCLPMVKYNGSLLSQPNGLKCIAYLHDELQKIIDDLCNDEDAMKSKPSGSSKRSGAFGYARQVASGVGNNFTRPPSLGLSSAWTSSIMSAVAQAAQTLQGIPPTPMPAYTAPNSMQNQPSSVCSLTYKAPKNFKKSVSQSAFIRVFNSNLAPKEDCAICMSALRSPQPVISLKVCNHFFHTDCIEQSLKMKPQCPICRKALSEPQGKSPSGTMIISTTHSKCGGYNCGSIVINYSMKSSKQKSYHDNPGVTHGSKRATAYLPNNREGQDLLKRLKYAFSRGLTFTVGTSATSGVPNQCTWASIHHKTSLSGGLSCHGFPDPNYFVNCNEELNNLGVPKTHLL